MSSTAEDDPFLQVQADVLHALPQTRSLYTSYLRIVSLSATRPPTSPEALSALSDVETSLSTLSDDLADLREAVEATQADPYKFGLEIEEVSRRKRFVDDVGGEIEDMRRELRNSTTTNNNTIQPSSNNKNGKNDNGNTRKSKFVEENDLPPPDSYAEFEQEQQLSMMREQDDTLDSVFHTVGNLRQQADDMGRELEEQTEMLGHVDGLADRVGGRLQTGMKRMGEVVRRNEETWSSCCIGALILVLIILLVLVLVL